MSRLTDIIETTRYGAGAAWDWLKRPWWHGASTGAGVLTIAAVFVVLAWPGEGALPDANQQDQEDLVRFVASQQFATLSAEQQKPYFDRMRELREQNGRGSFRDVELSEDERRQLHQNMRAGFQRHMEERIDAFFELPPEQRTAYLDQQIDEMQERMKDWQRRREQRAAQRQQTETARTPRSDADGEERSEENRRAHRDGDRRRGPTPERMKQRIEHSDPVRRARFMEYTKAMRKRMEERGIEPHWRGRHR